MEIHLTAGLKRFNFLAGEIDAAYHEAALRLGLSDSAMQVLYAICNKGESCPLNEICRLSGLSRQTINSALRKLETEGILYLEALSGRKKRACLTAQGKELAQRTVAHLMEIENSILDSWPEAQREQYLDSMQKYLTAFREKIKELST